MGVIFIFTSIFVIIGTSNAVNLTDGLDGLAILPSVMVAGGLGIIAYISGNIIFADYLNIAYLPGSEITHYLWGNNWSWYWVSLV